MLYRLNSSENREARSGPELPQPFSDTSKIEDLSSARWFIFFSFGSINRKISRSTRVILGYYASQQPAMSKQNTFMGVTCSGADRHLKAALLSIPRWHMEAWSSSLFQRRAAALWAHGWATSAQDSESTWKTANVSLNHWSTTGKWPIHTWALGSCPRPLNSYSSGSWPRFD